MSVGEGRQLFVEGRRPAVDQVASFALLERGKAGNAALLHADVPRLAPKHALHRRAHVGPQLLRNVTVQ